MNCPKCGAEAPEGARFCEIDGTPIGGSTPIARPVAVNRTGFGVCRCGAGPDAIDENGFCVECGIRRDIRLRDHVEIQLEGHFAGVTDRGIRHSENQDDMALAVVPCATGTYYIGVVCDGVSGSEGAAGASATAAKTVCAALERSLINATEPSIGQLIEDAVAEAHEAVCKLTYNHGSAKDPPETTIVVAVVSGQTAVIGWAGDSRAYWITNSESAIITRDHSWVNDVVDSGMMSEDQALLSPMAHAIVRCLGGASSSPLEPVNVSITTCTLPAGSRLLLCSDGLWNYAQNLEDLSGLVREVAGVSPLLTANRLVQFAIGKGGKDNITAVLLAL